MIIGYKNYSTDPVDQVAFMADPGTHMEAMLNQVTQFVNVTVSDGGSHYRFNFVTHDGRVHINCHARRHAECGDGQLARPVAAISGS